jgi:hypothetical protein
MNRKIGNILLLLTSVILAGVPESFALPQYLTSFTAVYGGGSCETCHVINPGGGQRDSNGMFGQHNSSNVTFQRRDPNRILATRSSNATSRQSGSNRTLPRNSYGTLFENQPDHATDPNAVLIAIGQPPEATAIQYESKVLDTETKAVPGFDLAVFVFGLSAGILLARRHYK